MLFHYWKDATGEHIQKYICKNASINPVNKLQSSKENLNSSLKRPGTRFSIHFQALSGILNTALVIDVQITG